MACHPQGSSSSQLPPPPYEESMFFQDIKKILLPPPALPKKRKLEIRGVSANQKENVKSLDLLVEKSKEFLLERKDKQIM